MQTTPKMDAAVLIENVSVMVGTGDHHKALLRNVSIAVQEGSFLSIIGASGCGKSTQKRTMIGMQPVSAGRVLLAGYPVETLRKNLPLAIGYLPQFGAFHGDLTVAEILHFAVALRLPRSVPKNTRNQWREHVIDLARIRTLLDQKYRTLSGGQQRRIALAEELIGDPAILFLDELTSGVDAHSEHELMVWLRELAHNLNKTVVLVSHAVDNLGLCDSVVFLHEGRFCFQGPYDELFRTHGTDSIESIFGGYQQATLAGNFIGFDEDRSAELPAPPQPAALNTARPPGALSQLFTLINRQVILLGRDRAQLWLHLALLIIFPGLVAIFGYKGLPTVGNLDIGLETNFAKAVAEMFPYLKDSFVAASMVSGLTMFQVILLSLTGANNGAREIAKEREILEKELRTGLSPWAYVTTKGLLVFCLSVAQAFWMAWLVKAVCNFQGSFFSQFAILFATTFAMSITCLAISSFSRSPERASLLAIYLVGLQLPLSGAVLALPETVSNVCRPFIAAYWGWSGYLKTLSATQQYDIVRNSTTTPIADYNLCMLVLAAQVIVSSAVAWFFVARILRSK